MGERHSNGGLTVYFPWTIVTAFGPIECGSEGDTWRQLWNGPKGAIAWAERIQAYKIGRHVFAAPLPETGDGRPPSPAKG